jgi:vacuolar-type H+-ATPase subunit E/Vma4
MEDRNSSVNELCRQILADAEAEAQKSLERARRVAGERMKNAHAEVEKYRNGLLKSAREKSQTARRKILSSVSLESKKIRLKEKGDLIDGAMKLVRERFFAFAGSDAFTDYLKNLIVEGVLALKGEEFVIETNSTHSAIVNDSTLKELEQDISKKHGLVVRLELSIEELKDAGVKVYTKDGRMLFDNSVKAIFKRQQDDLRIFLHNKLFE